MEPTDYVEEELDDTVRLSDPYSEAAVEEESDVGDILSTRGRSYQEGVFESWTYECTLKRAVTPPKLRTVFKNAVRSQVRAA